MEHKTIDKVDTDKPDRGKHVYGRVSTGLHHTCVSRLVSTTKPKISLVCDQRIGCAIVLGEAYKE